MRVCQSVESPCVYRRAVQIVASRRPQDIYVKRILRSVIDCGFVLRTKCCYFINYERMLRWLLLPWDVLKGPYFLIFQSFTPPPEHQILSHSESIQLSAPHLTL